MYYLQSRYYNPDWGRFINADAIAGKVGELLGANVFAYCKNNPVNFHDSNGFRLEEDMGGGSCGGAAGSAELGYAIIEVVEEVAQKSRNIIDKVSTTVQKTNQTLSKGVSKVVGELHHIASDKSIVSGFTAKYEKIFAKAGMSLKDEANLVFLEGHSGAHTNLYKQYVLDYITRATSGLSGDKCKEALIKVLGSLKGELISNPRMPYKGGM